MFFAKKHLLKKSFRTTQLKYLSDIFFLEHLKLLLVTFQNMYIMGPVATSCLKVALCYFSSMCIFSLAGDSNEFKRIHKDSP